MTGIASVLLLRRPFFCFSLLTLLLFHDFPGCGLDHTVQIRYLIPLGFNRCIQCVLLSLIICLQILKIRHLCFQRIFQLLDLLHRFRIFLKLCPVILMYFL